MSRILIVLAERRLYFYFNNSLNKIFPVAIGKESTPTPTGKFSIINKIKEPYNPALGSRWLQFSYQMHGIHGTNQPQLIGQAVSQGCVRMYNQDVEYIFARVSISTPIEIKIHHNSKKYFTYTVQSNDTLYSLANKFQTTMQAILKLNNLSKQDLIYPGQELKIPKNSMNF
ncbi:MAG: L,D-transpeptidase family protein [Halanaerobacter sp.]